MEEREGGTVTAREAVSFIAGKRHTVASKERDEDSTQLLAAWIKTACVTNI